MSHNPVSDLVLRCPGLTACYVKGHHILAKQLGFLTQSLYSFKAAAWGIPWEGVQWLGPHASTAGGTGSIPGWGTKIPQATQCGKKQQQWQQNCRMPPLALTKM